MAITASDFHPPPWLRNPHLQTLLPVLLSRWRYLPSPTWQTLPTRDGDFIDLAWFHGSSDMPLVLMLHGLEGSLRSHYIHALPPVLAACRLQGVLMHFRGCSGRHNRLNRAYHSGDSTDLAWVLECLRARFPGRRMMAVAYSLGGNVLLKYLGETGSNSLLDVGVAVSVPFELAHSARRLRQGFSRVYERVLLNSLIRRLRHKSRHRPMPLDTKGLSANMGFHAFDECVTAPLHGFRDADDYYRHCSSRQYLHGVRRPALIIQARDDPFLPPEAIPSAEELADSIRLELAEHGGHVGFYSLRERDWLAHRIGRFLQSHRHP